MASPGPFLKCWSRKTIKSQNYDFSIAQLYTQRIYLAKLAETVTCVASILKKELEIKPKYHELKMAANHG